MARTPDRYVWNACELEPAPSYSVTWGLEDLLDLTENQTENTLSQHRHRELWHPDDVDSVVCFLARYGTLDLRMKLMQIANESPARAAPSSLREAVEYRVRTSTDDFRLRVCRAALSGGGRERITERVEKKGKRKKKSPPSGPGE